MPISYTWGIGFFLNMSDVINEGILKEASNLASNGASPTGIDFLDNLLYPNLQQEKEFGQQVALTKYLNSGAYKDKFNALRELGIHPVTAAESLTGASSGAAAPASSQGAAAKSLEGMVSAGTGFGDFLDKVSSANERNQLLDVRRKNIIADTYQKYVDAGYTSEMAKNMAIANAFLPTEKYLGLVALEGQIDNLHAEYLTMMQGIEESKKRIEELDAQIKLAESQGNLNDKLALESEKRTLLIEAQTTEQNWYNDKMKSLDIDPRNPIENNVFMTGVKDGKTSYVSQLDIVRDVKYSEATGQYDSQVEHAYDLAYESGRADYEFNWSSPPKTISEFISKAGVNLREKFNSFVGSVRSSLNEKRSNKEQYENTLRASYLQYSNMLNQKREMLNMLRADLADKYANGANIVDVVDLKIQINKLQGEINKMPQNFKQFKNYVESR